MRIGRSNVSIKTRPLKTLGLEITFLLAVFMNPVLAANNWGLMAHDDGDLLFEPQKTTYSATCKSTKKVEKALDPSLHLQYVKCRYKGLRDAGIDTLKLNVFSGLVYFDFDKNHGPTLSRIDSKINEFDRQTYQALSPRIDLAKKLFDLGPSYDPVMIALREFRARGGKTVLSFRISDSHYLQVAKGSSPEKHPLTPQFFLTHQSWIIGASNLPKGADPRLGSLMDFERDEVRNHFLSAVQAGLLKYGHSIDGIEIDFTRNPFLFRANTAQKNSHLINEMLIRVRQMIKVSDTPKLSILVRLPTDMSYSSTQGLDVTSWVTNKLVDVVIPSELMNIDPDPAIGQLVALAKKSGVAIYYGIPGRRNTTLWRTNPSTSAGDAFLPPPPPNESCDTTCIKSKITDYHLPSSDYLIGAAINAKAKGVDGIELYNFASESLRLAPWYAHVLIPNLKAQLPDTPVSYSASQQNKSGLDKASNDVKLPISLNKNDDSYFRILVGSTAMFHNIAHLKIELLEKNNMECEVRFQGSDQPLMKESSLTTAYSNSNSINGRVFHRQALKSPGRFFPEGALVFTVPVNEIKNGYNAFQIRCLKNNVLMNAEIKSS